MKNLSATEATRRFSDVLDAVENRGETFLVVRRGRTVATIAPAPAASGARVKELLRAYRPDRAWAAELAELRASVRVEERSWTD